MNKKRGFICQIQEGTYIREVTVWVNDQEIETFGDDAIKDIVWQLWRDKYFAGYGKGMSYKTCTILEEIKND